MKIGVIGIGKIGTVLVETICKQKEQNHEVFITKRGKQNSAFLSEKYGEIEVMENAQEVVDKSDIVFLALRTDIVEEEIKKLHFRKEQKLVSVVPSVTMKKLKELVDEELEMCRMTPLPPMTEGLGGILLYQPIKEIQQLFGNMGELIYCVNEKELHGLWAVSCMISPYYEILSVIADSAEKYGATKEHAKRYTSLMCGALAQMATRREDSLRNLGDEAKTPGGLNELTDGFLTESGCYELLESAFDKVMERFPKSDEESA